MWADTTMDANSFLFSLLCKEKKQHHTQPLPLTIIPFLHRGCHDWCLLFANTFFTRAAFLSTVLLFLDSTCFFVQSSHAARLSCFFFFYTIIFLSSTKNLADFKNHLFKLIQTWSKLILYRRFFMSQALPLSSN